ncbi:MAG: phage portal protein [Xanthobacteraceae bacterium]
MGILDIFRRAPEAQPQMPGRVEPEIVQHGPRSSNTQHFTGWDDPNLAPFVRGSETASGAYVSSWSALHNTAVFRCVDLISSSIGMLPLYLYSGARSGNLERAVDHPLYDVLQIQPNGWQTAFEFKKQMQANVLTHGNAYAQIVRSGKRVVGLIPLKPTSVSVEQNADLSLTYTVTSAGGKTRMLPQSEIFHIRDLSECGVKGVSRVQWAKEAIGLALQTEQAAGRLFKNGTIVGGALTHPGKLGDTEFDNLNNSLKEKFTGAENAHKWLILEEGMEAKPFAQTAKDSQAVETRNQQVEEIARGFGVPRPLLMMDDTSWGSGIQTLSLLFVKFGLDPWFVAWEQAIARSLLTREERRDYKADFDERELLRGSTTEQIEFVTKALGAGGSRQVMTQNEARDYVGLPKSRDPDADSLKNPMTQPTGAPANDNSAPDTEKTA